MFFNKKRLKLRNRVNAVFLNKIHISYISLFEADKARREALSKDIRSTLYKSNKQKKYKRYLREEIIKNE